MAYYPQEKTIYTFPEKLTVLHPHIVCRKCNRPVDRLLALVRVGDGGCIKVQCHGKYAEVPTGERPLDAHNIANRSLKRAGEALGLGRIGFHVFRHTLASLAQAHGMTVGEVRGVLGHASAATSMLYVHGDAERARKVIETIGGKVN